MLFSWLYLCQMCPTRKKKHLLWASAAAQKYSSHNKMTKNVVTYENHNAADSLKKSEIIFRVLKG